MTLHYKSIISALAFMTTTATAFADATPLVSVEWLESNKANVDIIDLRSKIGLQEGESFETGHIPGAVKADYLKAGWRTSKDGIVGLLPEVSALEELIGKLGVTNDDHVVLVSAGNKITDFGSAARVYWTFKQLGHDKVSILEGGHRAWQEAGKELSTEATAVSQETYKANPQSLNVTLNEVNASYQSDAVQLIDGRPETQFIGEAKHKKAARAGHIPNAENLDNHSFFSSPKGTLLKSEELAKVAANVSDDKPVISYCNTGHWASTNWFILSELLGKKNVKVYDGSMVEWSAKPELPVVKQSDSNG